MDTGFGRYASVLLFSHGRRNERKFHSVPEGVDPVCANACPISDVKRQTAAIRDNRVVAFAVEAAFAREFFDPVDSHKAFDENIHQFDEEPEFLNGNNQGLVLLA
jgi:hypothetical protein